MRIVLPVECTLIEAVQKLVPGAPNRTIRRILREGRIRVNGKIVKTARHPLLQGDVVEAADRPVRPGPHGLEIFYEDADLVVVCKPPGLLTTSTPLERKRTAFAYLSDFLKRRRRARGLFLVHRLDKPASGLLVFAKSDPVKVRLKRLFEKHRIERRYWAIVEGNVAADAGTIRSRLVEEDDGRVHSTRDPGAGKAAVTHYRVLKRFERSTALEVRLETGRKNQIRVHLSELGHPIVGDPAYGARTDSLGRLGLHAFTLGFEHPVRKVPVLVRTPSPKEFERYIPEN